MRITLAELAILVVVYGSPIFAAAAAAQYLLMRRAGASRRSTVLTIAVSTVSAYLATPLIWGRLPRQLVAALWIGGNGGWVPGFAVAAMLASAVSTVVIALVSAHSKGGLTTR